MKGIVLAGGSGTRLHPLTLAVSKQLLPIYSKPMIYYPLATLMMAGIRDILVITTPEDRHAFERLLQDGSHWGIRLEYAVQPRPEGLAQAFIIGADFVGDDPVALMLGDNIFFGNELPILLRKGAQVESGGMVFGYYVRDPERYGVAEFDAQGRVISVEEKPKNPRSHYAITGLYFYANDVLEIARSIRPSARGELEITDVNRVYLERGQLQMQIMGRGVAWLDTGTPDSLVDAITFVKTIEDRQGLLVYSPEEVAFRSGFIDRSGLMRAAQPLAKTAYGQYLLRLADEGPSPAPLRGMRP